MQEETRIDTTGSSADILRWVWNHLVPKAGQSSSIQGELLRSIEGLRWEAQSNGNLNWDAGFERYILFLRSTILESGCLSSESAESFLSDLNRLSNFLPPGQLTDDSQIDQLPYVEDDLYDRICERIADFCRQNPDVVSRAFDPDQYR